MLRIVAFFAVLVIAALAIWFGVAALSISYNRCIQNNGQHSTEQYTSDGQEIVEGPIDNPTRFRLALVCGNYFANRNGEAFTGLFTIALTIATFFLGYLAWDQSNTNRAQLRAYVSTVPRGMSLLENGDIRVWLGQKNVGKTPAFHTRAAWGVIVRPRPLEKPLLFEQDDTFKGASPVYYPGSDHTPSRPVTLTADDLVKMLDKDSGMALYAAGIVKYTDAFRRDQTAEFCCFVDPVTFTEWYSVAQYKRKEVIPVHFRFAEFQNTASF